MISTTTDLMYRLKDKLKTQKMSGLSPKSNGNDRTPWMTGRRLGTCGRLQLQHPETGPTTEQGESF